MYYTMQNGKMGEHLNFQHSFWNAIQRVTYHCIWAIISAGVILGD